MECNETADFEIKYDDENCCHACTKHVGDLIDNGICIVYSTDYVAEKR